MSDSAHPCHNLSNPAAQIFMCRHCMAKFYDPIQRWRHSKNCKKAAAKNTLDPVPAPPATKRGASYTKWRIEESGMCEEDTVLQVQSPKKKKSSPDSNLSCQICKKVFVGIEEMKEHVKHPCNKPERIGPPRPMSTLETNPQMIVFENQLRQLEEAAKDGEESTCTQIESLLMAAQALQQNIQQSVPQEDPSSSDLPTKVSGIHDRSPDNTEAIDTSVESSCNQIESTVHEGYVDSMDTSCHNPMVVHVSATSIRLKLPEDPSQKRPLNGNITNGQNIKRPLNGNITNGQNIKRPLNGNITNGQNIKEGSHNNAEATTESDQQFQERFTCELLTSNTTGIKIKKQKSISPPIRVDKSSGSKLSICRNDKVFTRISKRKAAKDKKMIATGSKSTINTCRLEGCSHSDDKKVKTIKIPKGGVNNLTNCKVSIERLKDLDTGKTVKASKSGDGKVTNSKSVSENTLTESKNKSVSTDSSKRQGATTTRMISTRNKKKPIPFTKNKKETKQAVKQTKSVTEIVKDKKSVKKKETTKPKCEKISKCRVCDKVFKTLDLLKKHNKVPCKVRLTRNLTQKVLRPKRTVVTAKVQPKCVKKTTKPLAEAKLKMYDRKFTDARLEINTVKKSKKAKRKDKMEYNFCLTRSQTPRRPNWSIDYETLTEKEKYFYGFGLVSIDQIPIKCASNVIKQIEASLPKTSMVIDNVNEAPPVLEKVVEVRQHIQDDIYILNDPVNKCADPPPLIVVQESESTLSEDDVPLKDLSCKSLIENPARDVITSSSVQSFDSLTSVCKPSSPRSPIKSLEERHFLDAIGLNKDESIMKSVSSSEGIQKENNSSKENESNDDESTAKSANIGLQTNITTEKIMYPRPDFYRRFLKKMEKQRLKDEQEAKEREMNDKSEARLRCRLDIDTMKENIPTSESNAFDKFDDQVFGKNHNNSTSDSPSEVVVYPKAPIKVDEPKERCLPYDPKQYEYVNESSLAVSRTIPEEPGKVRYEDSKELLELIAKTLGIFPSSKYQDPSNDPSGEFIAGSVNTVHSDTEDQPAIPSDSSFDKKDTSESIRESSEMGSGMQIIVMNNSSDTTEYTMGIDVINVPKELENQLQKAADRIHNPDSRDIQSSAVLPSSLIHEPYTRPTGQNELIHEPHTRLTGQNESSSFVSNQLNMKSTSCTINRQNVLVTSSANHIHDSHLISSEKKTSSSTLLHSKDLTERVFNTSVCLNPQTTVESSCDNYRQSPSIIMYPNPIESRSLLPKEVIDVHLNLCSTEHPKSVSDFTGTNDVISSLEDEKLNTAVKHDEFLSRKNNSLLLYPEESLADPSRSATKTPMLYSENLKKQNLEYSSNTPTDRLEARLSDSNTSTDRLEVHLPDPNAVVMTDRPEVSDKTFSPFGNKDDSLTLDTSVVLPPFEPLQDIITFESELISSCDETESKLPLKFQSLASPQFKDNSLKSNVDKSENSYFGNKNIVHSTPLKASDKVSTPVYSDISDGSDDEDTYTQSTQNSWKVLPVNSLKPGIIQNETRGRNAGDKLYSDQSGFEYYNCKVDPPPRTTTDTNAIAGGFDSSKLDWTEKDELYVMSMLNYKSTTPFEQMPLQSQQHISEMQNIPPNDGLDLRVTSIPYVPVLPYDNSVYRHSSLGIPARANIQNSGNPNLSFKTSSIQVNGQYSTFEPLVSAAMSNQQAARSSTLSFQPSLLSTRTNTRHDGDNSDLPLSSRKTNNQQFPGNSSLSYNSLLSVRTPSEKVGLPFKSLSSTVSNKQNTSCNSALKPYKSNVTDVEISRSSTESRNVWNASFESIYSDISDDSNDSVNTPSKSDVTASWVGTTINRITDKTITNSLAETSRSAFSDISDDSKDHDTLVQNKFHSSNDAGNLNLCPPSRVSSFNFNSVPVINDTKNKGYLPNRTLAERKNPLRNDVILPGDNDNVSISSESSNGGWNSNVLPATVSASEIDSPSPVGLDRTVTREYRRSPSPFSDNLSQNSNDIRFAEVLFDQVVKKDKNRVINDFSCLGKVQNDLPRNIQSDSGVKFTDKSRDIPTGVIHSDSCDSSDLPYIVIDKGVEICRTVAGVDDCSSVQSGQFSDDE